MSGRVIDLRIGHPKASNLPHAQMASACRSAAARLDAETEAALPLNYAKSEYGSAGYLTALAGFLTAAYGSPVFDDWLLTTNGVSHGLELAVGCLTKPGDACWMESPSYFLAYQIFADHHLKVVGAPSDAHGLDVEALARCLADGTLGPPPAVLYLVPTHGNPTGVTLSRERREALLRLARQYGFVVLADEVYALLDWTAPDQALPPRMLALDAPHRKRVQQEAEAKAVASSGGAPSAVRAARLSGGDTSYTPNVARLSGGNGGNGGSAEGATPGAAESAAEAAAEAAAEEAEACGVVISVSSHTKILAPGIKLGWLEASPAMLERLACRGYLNSGGSVAPFTSEVVAGLLASSGGGGAPPLCGQRQVLDHLIADYSRGAAALGAAVRAAPPGMLELPRVPTGGFFAWVRLAGLPPGVTAQDLLGVAETRHGVVFLPGEMCAPTSPDTCSRYARLCFAYESADNIAEGVRRLAAAVEDMRTMPRPSVPAAETAEPPGAAARTAPAAATTATAPPASFKEPRAAKEGGSSKAASSARLEAKLDEVLTSLAFARGTLTAIAIVVFAGASVLLRRDGPTNPTVRIKFGL